MVINAIVDRIENGNAVLLSEDMGMEISIPEEEIIDTYSMGDTITLTFDGDFEVQNMDKEADNE
ncbi:MAG: DUF3006 family protein [Bacillota bacterium]|nr:DUF3006 family protein [Bacillota bacterium]